jgi:hypothetical protein
MDSRLLYTTVQETSWGPREISLYWDDISNIVFDPQNTLVIVSTTVFQKSHGPRRFGKAWRSIMDSFHSLDPYEDYDEVLRCGPDSVWKTVHDSQIWNEVEEKAKSFPPAILASSVSDADFTPRRIMLLRTLPHMKDMDADLEEQEYWNGISMLYSAYRCIEAVELCPPKSEDTGTATRGPYRRLVLSALGGRQGHDVSFLLKCLIEEARKWLQSSPHLEQVDFAYLEEKVPHENLEQRFREVRESLLDRLGEEPVKQSKLLGVALSELDAILVDAVEDASKKRGERPLHQAMSDMLAVVRRAENDKILLREFGAAGGRLTEALVYSLNKELMNSAPPTFFEGIERLRQRATKKGKKKDHWVSSWFHSYLHTLRTLRNECAHTHDEDKREGQFPYDLGSEDVLLLVIALRRVLKMHADWRKESPGWV